MANKFIHCTCGSPMVFNITKPIEKGSNEQNVDVIGKISIGGGAWVINKDSRIPKDVITPVTDEELAALEKLDAFQNMKKRGFITVRTVDYMEADSRGLPTDMEKKDSCSQIEDADHANGTDPRLDHGGTRATYGEGNQFGGMQPVETKESSYGEIKL